jgi:hypothetical protein
MGLVNKIKTAILTMAITGTGAYIGANYGKDIVNYFSPPAEPRAPTQIEYRPVDMFMDEMKYQVDELEKRVQQRREQKMQEETK